MPGGPGRCLILLRSCLDAVGPWNAEPVKVSSAPRYTQRQYSLDVFRRVFMHLLVCIDKFPVQKTNWKFKCNENSFKWAIGIHTGRRSSFLYIQATTIPTITGSSSGRIRVLLSFSLVHSSLHADSKKPPEFPSTDFSTQNRTSSAPMIRVIWSLRTLPVHLVSRVFLEIHGLRHVPGQKPLWRICLWWNSHR